MTEEKVVWAQDFADDLYNAALKFVNATGKGEAPLFGAAIAHAFTVWGVEAMDNLVTEMLATVQTRMGEYRQLELKYSGLVELPEDSDESSSNRG